MDTGTRFSPAGQAVILALIQMGGLGLMTFAVFMGVVLGRKVAFTDRMLIQESMHHTPKAGVRRLVRYVLTFTLAVEAAGAALLWLRFRGQFPAGEAIWQSVFHSVSAFCNAGFGLLPDNLVRYRGGPARQPGDHRPHRGGRARVPRQHGAVGRGPGEAAGGPRAPADPPRAARARW